MLTHRILLFIAVDHWTPFEICFKSIQEELDLNGLVITVGPTGEIISPKSFFII